ncbi:MAG: hypothetical protein A3B66_07620 [Alphaproteobacteria bacterium RIFCSPHIGHO2_02_FULL_46_13]|nr:MAG: hypothetical protein A3B66_07620 [Alphaproteobacteria bacterium RIFCSPHIGHO2_02_FULL_46_13]
MIFFIFLTPLLFPIFFIVLGGLLPYFYLLYIIITGKVLTCGNNSIKFYDKCCNAGIITLSHGFQRKPPFLYAGRNDNAAQ